MLYKIEKIKELTNSTFAKENQAIKITTNVKAMKQKRESTVCVMFCTRLVYPF
jgi:hypothetical protein